VFGYYSQTGLTWKEDMRVIDYVKSYAETFPLADGGALSAAKFLELFLFPPEKQYTYLSALSGGEKRRLQLLSILFSNPNFLILDEPTNDLDLPTLQVLENFLFEYRGCVLIVSHDRYFMDKLVDHLFVFEGGGVVRDFPGSYTLYRIEEEEKQKAVGSKQSAVGSLQPATQTVVQPIVEKRKPSFKEKTEFDNLGKEMPKLEAEKQKLTEMMNGGSNNFAELQKASNRIGEITKLLEEKELRWLELSEIV
jgi:ATP-binding cassette subfamily F protein uup